MRVCIIGGVAGGATAAARLRRLDEQAEIVMFERGEHISYANCGMPYHVSGRIKERSSLFRHTPQSFWNLFQVEVRVKNEVLAIEPERKRIHVVNRQSGKEYVSPYDHLILSPGAYPFVPPAQGVDASFFLTLHDIAGMDVIMDRVARQQTKQAVIVGGGFIGVELAENLVARGVAVHLVELLDQVMAPFDREMANILHAKLAREGVALHLSDSIARVVTRKKQNRVVLASGLELEAQWVISTAGVRPDTRLGREAGLAIGSSGGIVVDDAMRTSDPSIYAVGDVLETRQLVGGMPVCVPLAGPANKQARIAADNICGIPSRYPGTLGTSIVKVFDMQAAATGLNEKTLQKSGLSYQAIHLHPLNHSNYYPGAAPLALKLLFGVPDGKVLGAQCIGEGGVDKRIDVIATAIHAGMCVHELAQLELAYAPPFGSAKDPVNMAGFVGSNILQGLVKSVTCAELERMENPYILDIRPKSEFAAGHVPGAVHIPREEVRRRMGELPRDRQIVVICQSGVASYTVCRILAQSGFATLANLSGGYQTYSHYKVL
jgi:NADPH-dependent 2,4-dienoyl-CoA reductase/sulfur reductase-like enzyme/rhodanese-related sulfurtransferase